MCKVTAESDTEFGILSLCLLYSPVQIYLSHSTMCSTPSLLNPTALQCHTQASAAADRDFPPEELLFFLNNVPQGRLPIQHIILLSFIAVLESSLFFGWIFLTGICLAEFKEAGNSVSSGQLKLSRLQLLPSYLNSYLPFSHIPLMSWVTGTATPSDPTFCPFPKCDC